MAYWNAMTAAPRAATARSIIASVSTSSQAAAMAPAQMAAAPL
jgi:hypothetical protein